MGIDTFTLLHNHTHLIEYRDSVYKLKLVYEGITPQKRDTFAQMVPELSAHRQIEDAFRAVLYSINMKEPLKPIQTEHFVICPQIAKWDFGLKIKFKIGGKLLHCYKNLIMFQIFCKDSINIAADIDQATNTKSVRLESETKTNSTKSEQPFVNINSSRIATNNNEESQCPKTRSSISEITRNKKAKKSKHTNIKAGDSPHSSHIEASTNSECELNTSAEHPQLCVEPFKKKQRLSACKARKSIQVISETVENVGSQNPWNEMMENESINIVSVGHGECPVAVSLPETNHCTVSKDLLLEVTSEIGRKCQLGRMSHIDSTAISGRENKRNSSIKAMEENISSDSRVFKNAYASQLGREHIENETLPKKLFSPWLESPMWKNVLKKFSLASFPDDEANMHGKQKPDHTRSNEGGKDADTIPVIAPELKGSYKCGNSQLLSDNFVINPIVETANNVFALDLGQNSESQISDRTQIREAEFINGSDSSDIGVITISNNDNKTNQSKKPGIPEKSNSTNLVTRNRSTEMEKVTLYSSPKQWRRQPKIVQQFEDQSNITKLKACSKLNRKSTHKHGSNQTSDSEIEIIKHVSPLKKVEQDSTDNYENSSSKEATPTKKRGRPRKNQSITSWSDSTISSISVRTRGSPRKQTQTPELAVNNSSGKTQVSSELDSSLGNMHAIRNVNRQHIQTRSSTSKNDAKPELIFGKKSKRNVKTLNKLAQTLIKAAENDSSGVRKLPHARFNESKSVTPSPIFRPQLYNKVERSSSSVSLQHYRDSNSFNTRRARSTNSLEFQRQSKRKGGLFSWYSKSPATTLREAKRQLLAAKDGVWLFGGGFSKQKNNTSRMRVRDGFLKRKV